MSQNRPTPPPTPAIPQVAGGQGEAARPMMIAIIDHDTDHPKTDPLNPAFLMSWLAFNPTTRRVMVEVEAATPAGLQAFRDHYGIGRPNARGEARQDHTLPGDPAEWQALQGEAQAGDDPRDPQKHVKQAGRLRERLQRETEERERQRRDREGGRERADAPAQGGGQGDAKQ